MKRYLFKIPQEIWLGLAAFLLLFGMLSSHGIWTQEYRWQQVCLHMLNTHDYWHPYLDGKPYYDKPLLSYWLIIGIAKLNQGVLTNAVLRLPSVVAGLLTLRSTYWLTKRFFDRKTALLAAWLLLTTFYFVFWARVASADILNVAAIMLCLVWFFKYFPDPSSTLELGKKFWCHAVFFILIAVSALLKGLVAPVLIFLVLIPSLWSRQVWRVYFRFKPLVAMCVALLIYVSPFLISSYTQPHYAENGLVEVFRENILRFFEPFDHEGGWWTYFIYFPVYTLPWVLLLCLPSLWKEKIRCYDFPLWAMLSIFVFLSLSGSRRSYYILPIVPFAVIFIASRWQKSFAENKFANRCLSTAIASLYVILCAYFLAIQPYYYLHH